MLQKHMPTSLRALESLDLHFVRNMREIRSGETRLVKLSVNNEVLQLSMHASEFMLEGRYYKLISMQNIRNELDLREMEAWQKLIRVLSHEIMNSVAPIISLSATLHGLVTQAQPGLPIAPEALDKGLEAIKIRSEGLYNFTQSYRKLTGIPKLSLKLTSLTELFGRVKLLMQYKLDEHHIALKISGADVAVTIDPDLMEHVLINLVLNAIEALAGNSNAVINITTSKHMKGNVRIHVADNGEGMDEATLEKIFIPFFTTRTHGSGIGLAITKQILQLHQADIQVHSERGKGTEFVIVL
jgi:signal transduction histidine kinase